MISKLLGLTPGGQFAARYLVFLGRDAKERLERNHWCISSVESKYELIQVALEIFRLDTMMRTVEPRLEIPEDSVDMRKALMGAVG